MPREVVVITGLPGSGKTTLAGPIAAALDAALVARDTIKEALGDALGPVNEAQSQRLGRASYEVLFAIARSIPGRVVLESNFGARSVPTLQGLTEGPIVQLFCDCPVDVAVSRYNSRARHPVHRIPVVSEQRLREMGPVAPLPLNGRTITVDTTTPVDVEAVAKEVVETIGLDRAVPVLASLDIEATQRFYAEKMGFTAVARYPDYGIVERDGVQIHFWLTHDAEVPKATSCRVDVTGVDELYEEMTAAGVVHPSSPLTDQPWGLREFAVLDGDGNTITFGQRTDP